MNQPHHDAGSRSATPGRCLLGIAVITLLLSACANPGPGAGAGDGDTQSPTAAATAHTSPTPSSSYVVYPAPGTAAIEKNPICQLAENTAVPSAKRSIARGQCDTLLKAATNPVTKPVLPPPSSSPSSPQPTARPCDRRRLDARFEGGGLGTGNDFGEILIWNPTTQPCQLQGTVSFSAHNANGSPDHAAQLNRPTRLGPTVLAPGMTPPRDGKNQDNYLVAELMGPERDDPGKPYGLCRPQDEGTPATLELSIGSNLFRVPNRDPNSPQLKSVYGCHGRVFLEDVRGPNSN